MQSQSISVTFPKSHGSAPRNLAMVVRMPNGPARAPRGPVRFNSLKEAMEYLKNKETDKNDEE